MASLYQENDTWAVQFADGAARRKTLRIGQVTKKQATAVKLRVEQLASAQLTSHAADDDTTRWVEALSDALHGRLAAVGLVRPRESSMLKLWLDKYMAERSDLKFESRRKLQQTVTKLIEFFGDKTPLRSITLEQASAWRSKLQGDGLSEASLKIHAGNAKSLFAAALRRKLIPENPILHLPSGPTASKNERYVTPGEAEAVVTACVDWRFKLVFALARYAGLRIRSEGFALTWRDVDWEGSKLLVKSPKTERHAGHEQRWVPITKELLPILRDASERAAEGAEGVVPMKWTGFIPTRMLSIVKAAGVTPWPKLFQALRSSCEKEWAMTFPQYAVSKWIGHSIIVSGRHYVNDVPAELFEKASGKVVQKAVQQQAIFGESSGQAEETAGAQEARKALKSREIPQLAATCLLGDEGLEPLPSLPRRDRKGQIAAWRTPPTAFP